MKLKKGRIWYVVLSMAIAAATWLMFLVYFGRIDPVMKSATDKGMGIYTYGLVAVPFWVCAFTAPLLYPFICLYILFGTWILRICSQLASTLLVLVLGSLLVNTAAMLTVMPKIDKNKVTADITVDGLVGLLVAIINLIVIQIVVPLFEWYSRRSPYQVVLDDSEEDDSEEGEKESSPSPQQLATVLEVPGGSAFNSSFLEDEEDENLEISKKQLPLSSIPSHLHPHTPAHPPLPPYPPLPPTLTKKPAENTELCICV